MGHAFPNGVDATGLRDVQELKIAKLQQLISPQYPPHCDHSQQRSLNPLTTRWMDVGQDVSPRPQTVGPLGGLALRAPTEIEVAASGDLCPHSSGDIIPWPM